MALLKGFDLRTTSGVSVPPTNGSSAAKSNESILKLLSDMPHAELCFPAKTGVADTRADRYFSCNTHTHTQIDFAHFYTSHQNNLFKGRSRFCGSGWCWMTLQHAHDAFSMVACTTQQQSFRFWVSPCNWRYTTLSITSTESSYTFIWHHGWHHQ